MSDKAKAVRDAATALKKAIDEAAAAGFAVQWPHNPAGLAAIAVSETKGRAAAVDGKPGRVKS